MLEQLKQWLIQALRVGSMLAEHSWHRSISRGSGLQTF